MKCEFCNEAPPAPWIYCQKEECQKASLGKLLTKKASFQFVRGGGPEICPLCKETVTGTLGSTCATCKTRYHNDCLLELTGSRCSTTGCGRFVST